MSLKHPFIVEPEIWLTRVDAWSREFKSATPFEHVVMDDFLSAAHARFLAERFPKPDHPVWLDWKTRSPHQYGKQGAGSSRHFNLLDAEFRLALHEFNAHGFLEFVEAVTGIDKLIPDPWFTGGGPHQILAGGLLDIHTDFNQYDRMDTYRRVNVLIYLTEEWQPAWRGELELWDARPAAGGQCVKSVAPLFNRAVIFKTDKRSFHGHPSEWSAPAPITRRSIALYYYTAKPVAGVAYDGQTDFQGVMTKALPAMA